MFNYMIRKKKKQMELLWKNKDKPFVDTILIFTDG